MKRELEPYQMIERSIIKKYRKELWTSFTDDSAALVFPVSGTVRRMISQPCTMPATLAFQGMATALPEMLT